MSELPQRVSDVIERSAGSRPVHSERCHGGSINQAASVTLIDGRTIFAKWHARAPAGFFDAEADGLRRLRASLEKDGRPLVFEVLRRYDLIESEDDRPSYTSLAKELGLALHDIDNYLSQARKRLYQCVQEIVSESVDGPESLRAELDAFFPGFAGGTD